MSKRTIRCLLTYLVVSSLKYSSIGFVIRSSPTSSSSSTSWANPQLLTLLHLANKREQYRRPSITTTSRSSSRLSSSSREDDDNDNKNKNTSSFSKATTTTTNLVSRLFRTPQSWMMKRRRRNRIVRFGQTLVLALTFVFSYSPKIANAKFSHELQNDKTVISLRPGMSQEQATKIVQQGEIPDDFKSKETNAAPGIQGNTQQQQNAASSSSDSKTKSSSSSNKKKKKKKTKNTFDYGDDEDEFDDDFLDAESNTRKNGGGGGRGGTRTSISKSDMAKSTTFQASTKSTFSSGTTQTQAQSKLLTLKVSIGLFIPTWGAMGVREFVRRRKEEIYVQKGLSILEQQKAEYFNITKSDDDDDDDEDDDDDDDDNDDDDNDDDDDDDVDDDDDEEDDPSPPRRKPKRPTGGGGGEGGDGGSGDGSDDGSGRPSEDDLKRLSDLFDKS
eukprot:scaffold8194_cov118-Cylindrotheca_fusiformis.AAC.5